MEDRINHDARRRHLLRLEGTSGLSDSQERATRSPMTWGVSSCLAPQRGERVVSWVSIRIPDPVVRDPPLQLSLLATTSLYSPWTSQLSLSSLPSAMRLMQNCTVSSLNSLSADVSRPIGTDNASKRYSSVLVHQPVCLAADDQTPSRRQGRWGADHLQCSLLIP